MDAKEELRPGDVRWHTSDGDCPTPDVGFELQIAPGVTLWAGEISRQRWEEAGGEDMGRGSDDGWWIILYKDDTSEVIAKAVDKPQAENMIDAISAGIRSARRRH